MFEQYLPFVGLIIFGNIENLVLSSQGVVAGVNPVKLGIASIICVSCWLLIGTFGTQLLIDYVDFINYSIVSKCRLVLSFFDKYYI